MLFEVSEELISVNSLNGTTTGENILREVVKTVQPEVESLRCVSTDGGKNMWNRKRLSWANLQSF